MPKKPRKNFVPKRVYKQKAKQVDAENSQKLTKAKKRKKFVIDEKKPKMPLNKYLAHANIATRKDAAALIKKGLVTVNGEVENNPAYQVQEKDEVIYKSEKVTPSKDRVYILLNKPKGVITSHKRTNKGLSVMDMILSSITDERVYPVGKLSKSASGLVLITNDGELANELSDAKSQVEKVFKISLDQELKKSDLNKIKKGVNLDDQTIMVDDINYLDEDDKSQIGVQIHTGVPNAVKRIFTTMGYKVNALDRVIYAGLSKKNLPRGKHRILNAKEIVKLKHFNKYRL